MTPRWTTRLLVGTGVVGVVLAAGLRALEGVVDGAAPLFRVVALGVVGVVPLAIAALPPAGETAERLRSLAAIALVPCGAAALAALFTRTGPAGLWASAWMGFAILAAILGLSRLGGGRRRDAAHLVGAAALAYLPVGAAWLVASRMGARPMGFDPMIVLLTAVHFHFSAVGGSVIASRTIGALEGRPRRLAAVAGLSVVAAIPIVAAGITFSPVVALVGAVVLALALLTVGALTIGAVRPKLESRAAKVLLVISALSLLLSMPLAVLYAIGQVTGESTIGIEWMVRLHGYANAHGFVTCGLLGWVVEDRARARAARALGSATERAPARTPGG